MLEEVEWVYVGMGELGWSPPDVDAMELWQVGRFLGLENTGKPVIRGAQLRQVKDGPQAPAVPDPRTIDPATWGTDASAEQAMLAMMRRR